MAETKRFTRAPHLGRRRLVRAYFLPWVQIPAGLIFVVLSYNLPTERFYLFVWFLLFSLCVIVQDMVRPYSRVIRFWYWLFGEKLCWSRWQFTPDVDKLEQYNPHPAPPLWQYRYQMGWVAAVVSLLLIWGAALVQSQLSVTDTAEIVSQTLLVCGLLAFGIVPYGLITARLMSHLSRNIRLIIWLVLALVIGGPIIAVSLYWLTGDLTSTILVTLLFFLLYTAVFVNQRIWVGRQAIGEVVQEVSRTFLSWPETSQKIDTVPELIGE